MRTKKNNIKIQIQIGEGQYHILIGVSAEELKGEDDVLEYVSGQ